MLIYNTKEGIQGVLREFWRIYKVNHKTLFTEMEVYLINC